MKHFTPYNEKALPVRFGESIPCEKLLTFDTKDPGVKEDIKNLICKVDGLAYPLVYDPNIVRYPWLLELNNVRRLFTDAFEKG